MEIKTVKAKNFAEKLLGLMFKKDFAGYLALYNCRAIHTSFMFFPIDIICINNKNRVTLLKEAIKPWRLFIAPKNTKIIIEMKSEKLKEMNLKTGDYVEIR